MPRSQCSPAACASRQQRFRLRLQAEREPLGFERLLQHPRCRPVELTLHQPRHQVHDRDFHAAQLETVGGFEPEQSAADDHRVRLRLRSRDHRFGIRDVPVSDDAGKIDARDRQDERVRSRRQQHTVVGRTRSIRRMNHPLRAVDLRDRLADMQRDAVLVIPFPRIEHDLLDRLLARQHR